MTRHNIKKEKIRKEKEEKQEAKFNLKKEIKEANLPLKAVGIAAIVGSFIFIRKASLGFVIAFGFVVGVIYSFKDHWIGRKVIGRVQGKVKKTYEKMKGFFTKKEQGKTNDKGEEFVEGMKTNVSKTYESVSELFSDKQEARELPDVKQNL